jgi:hypothetical protein
MHLRLPILSVKGSRSAPFLGDRRLHGPGLSLLLTLLILLGCFAPVFAFGPGELILSLLDTSAFPTISFYLEPYDSQGQIVSDLKPDQISILEDHRALKPQTVTQLPRGVQFTVAVNTLPALSNQVNGSDQFSAIRQDLLSWAAGQSAEFGDFSLAGNTGLQLIRSRNPREWSAALDAYQPDLAKEQSGLFALTTAMDLASEQSSPDKFKPAILFITPPLDKAETSGIDNQIARAAQMGLPVFVWLVVADPNAPQTTIIPGMAELQNLADQTGGELALVSAGTPFPDLNKWLEPLSKIYRVEYPSGIKSEGKHTLNAKVDRPGLSLASAQNLSFDLDVLAPNPMFINPPTRLERTWNEISGQNETQLEPSVVDLQVLVEFPDGINRPLRASRLYINNSLAAENTAEPFDRFSLDLKPFTENTNLSMRVEVEDSIGMKGASIESPVDVVIAELPERGLFARITPQGMVAVAAVLIAGAVLIIILVSENRQRPLKSGLTAWRRKNDPLTQPVTILQEPAAVRQPRRAVIPSPSWPRGSGQPVTPARLVRLTENEVAVHGNQVPINRPELTFGSDPRQAIIALGDASVCPLHARLLQTREGGFLLEDNGSIAGTWVNYAQVPKEGKCLIHGDLIHFGRLMYRFELAAAPKPAELIIRLVDEEP